MFEVNNGVAKIDGKQGIYSEKSVTNPSERWGKNAVQNFQSYAEAPIIADSMKPAPILDFGFSPDAADKNAEKVDKFLKENDEYLNALPPLKFEYRYMPNITKNGEIDKTALLAAANEEMDKKEAVSVDEMNYRCAPDENYTFEPLDINKDGKISNSEYASSILAADMLSKSDTPDPKNIDGTVNARGMNAILEYSKKSNAEAAAKLYSNIYNKFNLGA